jgi:hypothetical protein
LIRNNLVHWQAAPLLKKTFLFITLAVFIVLVNYPLILADLMYIEQPILYRANQSIHSLHDLLQVYLHPQFLDLAVPFFRPSGHFLIYQLLTPLTGWNDTHAFLIVNLLFLAVCCYQMISLYQKLFPGCKIGGYIAAALYLMQPALMQSRLTVMHFEFAYVAFVLLALNYFVTFCQRHPALLSGMRVDARELMLAMIFFIIAVTFKEPALMLGPVLVSYFFINYYQQSFLISVRQCLQHKIALEILSLITLLTLALVIYMTLPWQAMALPLRDGMHSYEVISSIKGYIKFLFNLLQNFNFLPHFKLNAALLAKDVQPRYIIHLIDWSLLICLPLAFFKLGKTYGKSVIFLAIALGLFLVLPILWSVGMPWHLSLSLVCLNLLMGFGFERVFGQVFASPRKLFAVGLVAAVFIGSMTIPVDKVYLNFVATTDASHLFSALNYNAVFHPPAPPVNLRDDSVLVVEDNADLQDYELGDSLFSYGFYLQFADFPANEFRERNLFIKHNPHYNGTLFRWAYQKPGLREEVVPFKIAGMHNVADAELHSWLENFDNIFCFGYDKQNNWHDHTALFKAALLAEKNRRHITVNAYQQIPHLSAGLSAVRRIILPYGDTTLCRTSCDNVKACQGFNYIHVAAAGSSVSRCDFYEKAVTLKSNHCEHCESFVKLVS